VVREASFRRVFRFVSAISPAALAHTNRSLPGAK
jgi:hypothetical protein